MNNYYLNQCDPCNNQGVYSNINNRNVCETKIIGPRGPRGCPGQAATITIGTVTTGDTASVTNVGTNTNAILNFVLPTTPTTTAFASLYSNTTQTFALATGYQNVDLINSTSENVTFNDATNEVTINEAGLYQITYNVTPTTGANNGNAAILRNAVPVAGSIKGIVLDNAPVTATVDLQLNAGDTIALGITTTANTIELTAAPITNANLAITKIS